MKTANRTLMLRTRVGAVNCAMPAAPMMNKKNDEYPLDEDKLEQRSWTSPERKKSLQRVVSSTAILYHYSMTDKDTTTNVAVASPIVILWNGGTSEARYAQLHPLADDIESEWDTHRDCNRTCERTAARTRPRAANGRSSSCIRNDNDDEWDEYTVQSAYVP